jgi:hypothetical protein
MINLGDTVYQVVKKINAFSRKKITMTDENGISWYRYDMPVFDWKIRKWKVVGKVKYEVEGDLIDDHLGIKNGHVEYGLRDETDDEMVFDPLTWQDIYLNETDALEAIEKLYNDQSNR